LNFVFKKYYGLPIADDKQRENGFPLHVDADKELPTTLAECARLGDLSYITSKNNESVEIWLLVMKSFLADLFPLCPNYGTSIVKEVVVFCAISCPSEWYGMEKEW